MLRILILVSVFLSPQLARAAEDTTIEDTTTEDTTTEDTTTEDTSVDADTPASEDLAEAPDAMVNILVDQMSGSPYDRPIILRPIIGGRVVNTIDDSQGAFILGLNIGGQSQLNKPDAAVPVGILGRARYLGSIGSGRGRSLRVGPRFWGDLGPIRLEVGGDLATHRSMPKSGPALPGVVALGADTRVQINAGPISVLGGLQPEWFVSSGERRSRDADGFMPGLGDELSYKLGARVLFLSATWTHTITGYGNIDTVIAGLEF